MFIDFFFIFFNVKTKNIPSFENRSTVDLGNVRKNLLLTHTTLKKPIKLTYEQKNQM